MRYTAKLNDKNLSSEEAEEKLRRLLAPTKILEVFGYGRNANINVTRSQLEQLRERIGKEVKFQQALEAGEFPD